MTRREDLMLYRRGAQTDSQAYRRQPNPPDLPLLLAAGKSGPGLGEHMGK